MRASFLKSSVSPTSGGLNKEKRRENIEREADEEAHWTQVDGCLGARMCQGTFFCQEQKKTHHIVMCLTVQEKRLELS